ncbi:MAG: hypothetical protein QOH88_3569 [Verrucomicrobiota bacterium]|jgi:hypothetical protein
MGIAQLLRVVCYEIPRAVILAPWGKKFRVRLHRVSLSIPF